MNPEEATRLAALGGAADALVTAPGTPARAGETGPAAPGEPSSSAPQEPGAQLAKLRQENLDLMEMGIELIEPMLPMIRQCYTPAVCAKIAERGAAVEMKYGVSLPGLFGKYQDEIMLAVVAVPPTIKLVMAARIYIAELKAKAQAEADAKKKGEPPSDGKKEPAAAT